MDPMWLEIAIDVPSEVLDEVSATLIAEGGYKALDKAEIKQILTESMG